MVKVTVPSLTVGLVEVFDTVACRVTAVAPYVAEAELAAVAVSARVTANEVLIADVTPVWVVSLAVMVYGEPAVELICSPLKLATPLAATTEMVPAAKLCEDSARLMVSVQPVLPVVIGLPNWSSTVTPSDTVPPAVIVPAGWVVITSLFSATGLTVMELLVAD